MQKYSPEQESAMRSIFQMMSFWEIDLVDIERAPSPPAKYQHPVTGQKWSGIGHQPDWLRQALTKEGYTVDELRRAVVGSAITQGT